MQATNEVNEKYVKVPIDAARTIGGPLGLYITLSHYQSLSVSKGRDYAYPGQERLAEEFNVSCDTIGRWARSLEPKWLTVVRRSGRPNRYYVHATPQRQISEGEPSAPASLAEPRGNAGVPGVLGEAPVALRAPLGAEVGGQHPQVCATSKTDSKLDYSNTEGANKTNQWDGSMTRPMGRVHLADRKSPIVELGEVDNCKVPQVRENPLLVTEEGSSPGQGGQSAIPRHGECTGSQEALGHAAFVEPASERLPRGSEGNGPPSPLAGGLHEEQAWLADREWLEEQVWWDDEPDFDETVEVDSWH